MLRRDFGWQQLFGLMIIGDGLGTIAAVSCYRTSYDITTYQFFLIAYLLVIIHYFVSSLEVALGRLLVVHLKSQQHIIMLHIVGTIIRLSLKLGQFLSS